MDIIKQCVGIDIAKKNFTACVGKKKTDGSYELVHVSEFSNDKRGHNQFIKWVGKSMLKGIELSFAMEATGIYWEHLAYHLSKLKKTVSVLLPNKVSHYGKSLNVKTKTDIVDSKIIAMMGCDRNLPGWSAPPPLYKRLRAVCRLHRALQNDKTQSNNRLKQLMCSYEPLVEAIRIYKSNIKRIDKELAKLELQMKQILQSDSEVWSKVENLLTIKGIGLKTVAIVLGETQGFTLIKNQRQLTSYCGYDVVKRESGTSIKGKTRISKKGNSNIRSAMHFPSMVATRFNSKMKEVYQRVVDRTKVKKIGLVCIQRRLLVLMYSLWKTNKPYQEDYHNSEQSGFHEEEVTSSSSTRRVEMGINKDKVVEANEPPTTQNEHLYDQSSEALLRQRQIS